MTREKIEKLIDAGFIAKQDCNGEEFYSHESGIVIRQKTADWLYNHKLNTARSLNV